jgi:ABC-type multidrug transport system fused ATPase/permease subunit
MLDMVTGRDFSWKLTRDFVVKTFLFAILDSLNRYMKNRVALENKFEIRRLVLEKVLFAEVGELELIKSADLEHKVMSDISSTLNFVNSYLPSLVSGIYTFLVEGSSLILRRKAIDPLALAYPIVITILVRFISWAQYKYYTKPQKKISKANQNKLDDAMAVALDGIIDIQTNNLQQTHLFAFDRVATEEIGNKEGVTNFMMKSFSTLNKMSAFSYIIEIWCVHRIMKRLNLDHKQYSKIQQEIDNVVTIGRRTFNLLRKTKHIFQYQSKVVKLLDMKNFMREHLMLPKFEMQQFRELRMRDIVFAYSPHSPPALNLADTELCFLPGKRYAVIGQNTAGKSTLTKLITKLYEPSLGDIAINGIPYESIPRVQLRDYITYIPQRPLIVGGTIRDNLLLGNPGASEEELLAAAEASGLLEFIGATVAALSPASFIPRSRSVDSLSQPHQTDDAAAEVGVESPRLSSIRRVSSARFMSRSAILGNKRTDPDEKKRKKDRKKKKKKQKKKQKNLQKVGRRSDSPSSGDRDSDSDEDLPRTLSFAELGEIVQPSHDLQDGGYSSNKYPVHLSSVNHARDDFDDDSISDSDSDSLEGEDYDQEEEEIHKEDEDDVEDLVTSRSEDEQIENADSKLDREAGASTSRLGVGPRLNVSTGELRRNLSDANLAGSGTKRQKSVLDMEVAAGGGDISSGFAQSIALARVFIRTHAKLIILDEAVSQMDQLKLRSIVFPKLFEFASKWNMCLIVITHNLISMADFDEILVMHDGQLVHQGTHLDLLSQRADMYLSLLGVTHDEVDLLTPRGGASDAKQPGQSFLSLRKASSYRDFQLSFNKAN